ncbi:hypothetical protein [Lactobacillus crispatus]|uniref:hypothetical protein n=1 Tax=Lactobacillus crispatus TaxID=47770 RepID=UPI00254B47BB|nr:hypothetical protein [Lactobacillus crispatus]MDK7367620.1 hypothetical protein [Lactobacillus crispatus]
MTDFTEFESTIFSSDDNFAIRKIKHNVILTYCTQDGEKEYESLSKNIHIVYFLKIILKLVDCIHLMNSVTIG